MSDIDSNGLRRFADVVDVFQKSPIDVDSARLLEADDDTLRGQLTVTVRDDDLDVIETVPEPDNIGDEADDDTDEIDDILDHTDLEDLELAYDEADGNISEASERFEVGYGAVYQQMINQNVHETKQSKSGDTNDETGTSIEEDTTKTESEAHIDLGEDAQDDAPAGTGDDVQEDSDEITVDAVDGEKDEPDIALPDGVTEADVQSATEDHEGLGDVANELGVTRGRARAITLALDCYGHVRDIPGDRR